MRVLLLVIGSLLTIAVINFCRIARIDVKQGAEKTLEMVNIQKKDQTSTVPAQHKPDIKPTEETPAPVKQPMVETGTKKFLYIIKNGKAVKCIPVLEHSLGILYLAKDGRTVKFLPTKPGKEYKIYKQRRADLDKQLLEN
ncbi:hypothetical protein JW851_02280 [Candidatus Woesearchaeota archaeon]|nr:hypothetical protein [Candidatus Woesearchaeota archaeon]